jgi:hypothetical protein
VSMGGGKSVLVVGGAGFYGRYLVHDLLAHCTADVVVASRSPRNLWPGQQRVRIARCDAHDRGALDALVHGCDLVVNCAGPFNDGVNRVLESAIACGRHYIDIAETRDYRKAVIGEAARIAQAGIAVFSGMSVSPGMEALVGEMMRHRMGGLDALRTYAAPDTRKHRGKAMFETMLVGVGKPYLQPTDHALRRVHGWTEGEWVTFPPPIGRRLTYLVLEMANLDVLPEMLGVGTVAFKAGTEWPLLNRMLNLAARIRAATGHPQWERFTPAVRAMSWLAGRFGNDAGGVIFAGSTTCNDSTTQMRFAIMSAHDGGLIPSVLASIAAQQLLHTAAPASGIAPMHTWLPFDAFVAALTSRGMSLWWQLPGEDTWTQD